MAFDWFKGHGTENDFLVLPDHDGSVHGDLDPDFVAALCHRRRGLGADGVLRVIRAGAIAALGVDVPGTGDGADPDVWFMDYRNADGSIAEMCGNGVRVFARHLAQQGLVDLTEAFGVATRDGVKTVTVDEGGISVDMGEFRLGGSSKVVADGRRWSAAEVHTGNPHAVAIVDHVDDAGTLLEQPQFDTAVYPEGVNIEFVQEITPTHVRLRVHERGSGETRSCGTGACAASVAFLDGRPGEVRVDVPGGTVHVTVTPDGRTILRGPAEIVAAGRMEWYA